MQIQLLLLIINYMYVVNLIPMLQLACTLIYNLHVLNGREESED